MPLKPPKFPPTLNSLQCGNLVQSITNLKSHQKGKQLHAYVISTGVLINNAYLATRLCAMYASNGRMAEARLLFDGIAFKNSFLWNSMIRGYASNGFSLDSIAMYRDMLRSGNNGDNFSYPFVLMACGDLSLVQIGKRIHCDVIVSGYEPDVYVGNSLLAMYAKFGEMGVARKVFDRIAERDLTSWNTIISGYMRNCDPGKAISVFSVVAKGKEGLDQLTLVAVLPACANLSALKQGKEIHAYILRSGMEFNKILMNSLIDVYIKSNFMMGSKRLFERMDNKDTVSWNTMISGLACHGDAIESLTLFHGMNHMKRIHASYMQNTQRKTTCIIMLCM